MTQITTASDPSQCSHLLSGNAKSFMTSWLLLASGSLIAPVFASILRSVETRVSNLLVDLLTIRSLLSFHLPGLAHSIFESGAGNSTCFFLSKEGLGILPLPFPPTQVSLVFVFSCSRSPPRPPPNPHPPPTHLYFCG